MSNSVSAYFRCPERYTSFALKGTASEQCGYFNFGENILYGRVCGGTPADSPADALRDLLPETTIESGTIYLPFDAAAVLNNLREERYSSYSDGYHPAQSLLGRAYYLARPVLPVKFRKYLQQFRLKGWNQLQFPSWPVDRTADAMLHKLLLLSLRANGMEPIPFIWFWPDGAPSAAVMTHDVETTVGRDFCTTLMDIDDSFGIKAAFQVVPEQRYEVTRDYLNSIANRGFEVCVQDLNHDGRLYRDKELFLKRAAKINSYGREWGAAGFRAGVLYRRQDWFDALQFEYDMSVPNVAHLDPQRGGCCTVMPYFVGGLLEIPVTATQDYSLFHILRDYSLDLWKQQIDLIMEKHGLLSFIIHPDYIITDREQKTYKALLAYLTELRDRRGIWIATPGDVNKWWRQRAQMNLVNTNDGWRIEGVGSEKARIAYAREENGRLVLQIEPGLEHAASQESISSVRSPGKSFSV